jgi:methyltransferase (TIGR00027 family)
MSSSEKINDDPIGRTSLTSAAARASESKRSDPLLYDPFAAVYACQMGPESVENFSRMEQTTVELFTTDIVVRTRYLDDLLMKTIITIKQIVILACGGDFRPYRLPLTKIYPCADFYLLDVPPVLAYRQKCMERLEPSPPAVNYKIVEIGCDLTSDEWLSKLLEHGFHPDQPTFWLAEGFFQYLVEKDIRRIFDQIRQMSAKDSHIAFDLVSSRRQKALTIIRFAVDDEQEARRIFTEFGCVEIECTSFQQIGVMYGRSVSRDRTFIVNTKLSHL